VSVKEIVTSGCHRHLGVKPRPIGRSELHVHSRVLKLPRLATCRLNLQRPSRMFEYLNCQRAQRWTPRLLHDLLTTCRVLVLGDSPPTGAAANGVIVSVGMSYRAAIGQLRSETSAQTSGHRNDRAACDSRTGLWRDAFASCTTRIASLSESSTQENRYQGDRRFAVLTSPTGTDRETAPDRSSIHGLRRSRYRGSPTLRRERLGGVRARGRIVSGRKSWVERAKERIPKVRILAAASASVAACLTRRSSCSKAESRRARPGRPCL